MVRPNTPQRMVFGVNGIYNFNSYCQNRPPKRAVSIYTCVEACASTLVTLDRISPFIFVHLMVGKQMVSR